MSEQLVDRATGLVSRRIFSDPELYEQELERIFACCWLLLGHDSVIPKPGDYVTSCMGEDAVIVCRDPSGRVRAFLNTCRHRGNTVCLFDRGHATTFTCSYHGWSYSSEGKLTGVPFEDQAYFGGLDRDRWGLVEVPQVGTYRGLIFGCWDPSAPSLDSYLGDLRWYLDNVYLAEELEMLPQVQKYQTAMNWKVPADNFTGDHYHNVYTHASVRALGLYRRTFQEEQTPTGRFEVAVGPHGLGGLETAGARVTERDVAQAQRMGPHITEWLHERYARMQERLRDLPAPPTGYSRGNIFPNFSYSGGGGFTAFGSYSFYVWHPRGPDRTEAWHMLAVERAAPPEVKEMVIRASNRTGLSASGMFAQDDHANFERVTDGTRPPFARRFPFHYGMAVELEGEWPGSEGWQVDSLPGEIAPHFAEQNQRRFYAHWAELMGV